MSAGDSARSTTRQRSGIRYTADGEVLQADPSKIVNAFRSVDASEDTFGNELPELDLPGFGEMYETCGDPIPRFCADCGKTHMVGQTCRRSTCSRCANAWARKQGTRIAAKLEATRRYQEAGTDGWAGYKFHHLTLSPPDGYATFSHDPLGRTIELLKEVLDELGVSTGVIFYHPFRGVDGDDRGAWKGRLFDGREWDDVREEVEHSPHFHVVAVAKHVDGGHITRAIERETGWLVKRITKGGDSSESNVSIYDKYDLARAVTYCLSHTGLEQQDDGSNRAAYRYFGRTHGLVATDEIEAEMDAAVRSVAPKTLDLPWSSLACTEDRDGRDPQSPLVASTTAAYQGDGDGDGDGDGAVVDDEADPPEGMCAGRLLDITKAPAFLDDDDWLAAAPHADELRETWAEWRDRVDRPPPD